MYYIFTNAGASRDANLIRVSVYSLVTYEDNSLKIIGNEKVQYLQIAYCLLLTTMKILSHCNASSVYCRSISTVYTSRPIMLYAFAFW